MMSLKVWREKAIEAIENGEEFVEGAPMGHPPEWILWQCDATLCALEGVLGLDTIQSRSFGCFVGTTSRVIAGRN